MTNEPAPSNPESSSAPTSEGTPVRFRLPESSEFRTIDGGDEANREESRLKDHLRTSLQMQHLAFLCGSGTSQESGYPSMSQLWRKAQSLDGFDETRKSIGYDTGSNLEEFLSRCDAFLELNPANECVKTTHDKVVGTILDECRRPASGSRTLPAHRNLLKKIARRRARDSRVKLFTTNYDLCFEIAAGELGVVPIDGFSFGSPRRFDPRFFDYDIIRRSQNTEGTSFVPGVFQYYKLHGSVDWRNEHGTIEVAPNVTAGNACLIYPARAKFQRSYEQPHLELMARYLATLREPNTCLVVAGFGFNDDHLSGPILAALRSNPHFRLIVVCRDPESKLRDAADSPSWRGLKEVAPYVDVSFIAASFSRFVELIPDLSALSRADDLQASIVRAVKDAS